MEGEGKAGGGNMQIMGNLSQVVLVREGRAGKAQGSARGDPPRAAQENKDGVPESSPAWTEADTDKLLKPKRQNSVLNIFILSTTVSAGFSDAVVTNGYKPALL